MLTGSFEVVFIKALRNFTAVLGEVGGKDAETCLTPEKLYFFCVP